MIRIVAGRYGGRGLAVPRGRETRPTSQRVREALFNTLAAAGGLQAASFADLYAGSGAVGLEAASRGASRVLLVESQPLVARVARANIGALAESDNVSLIVAPVARVLADGVLADGVLADRVLADRVVADRRCDPPLPAGVHQPYEFVFADPPYSLDEDQLAAVLRLLTQGWLAEKALVVVERGSHSPEPRWPAGMRRWRERRYGDTTLWYGSAT